MLYSFYTLGLFVLVTGPTSFAPIVEMALTIVEQSGGQYHVLVIIADGQVNILISCFLFVFITLFYFILFILRTSDQVPCSIKANMIFLP